MVKGYKPINHDAHSESAFRTLPVSEKPSMGKPLYDLVATNSNGMSASNAGFDAERYIHQKIREYTLRSAAHWSSVQDTLPQHAAKLQQQENAGEDERALLLSVASAIDSASLRSLGLQEIPKALRAFALMHLLRNSGIAAEDMIRDGASAGMALHPAVVHQSSASKVRVEHSTKHRSTGAYSDKVSVSFESSSLSLIQGAVSLLLVLGLTGEERTKSGVSTRYLLKRISEVCGKYEDRVDLQAPWSSKVSRAHGASKLCERCFGTAPIWYQQSMENGPPG